MQLDKCGGGGKPKCSGAREIPPSKLNPVYTYISTTRKLKFPGVVLVKEKYCTYHISDKFSEPGNFHISCIIHLTS